MNEILLTDDEIAEVEHDAHDVCSRCEGEGRLWADGLVHYYDANRPTKACPNCDGHGRVLSGNEGVEVARAQLRKVVEWMEKHSYWEDKVHLIVSRDTMQALRAAAEEERG